MSQMEHEDTKARPSNSLLDYCRDSASGGNLHLQGLYAWHHSQSYQWEELVAYWVTFLCDTSFVPEERNLEPVVGKGTQVRDEARSCLPVPVSAPLQQWHFVSRPLHGSAKAVLSGASCHPPGLGGYF